MKKLFAVVALALMTLTISAQDGSNLTLKAGVGVSSVVGSDADTKMTLAYKAGISYDLGMSENFSIIPGAEFVTKGFKADNVEGNIGMSYIQVPIFAAFKLPVTDVMKVAIKVGPYASYGVFGSDIEWANGKTTNVFDSDGGFERFDAGAIAGLSFEFEQFMLGLEYSRGLLKLDKDFKMYNQAFGIVLGYKL